MEFFVLENLPSEDTPVYLNAVLAEKYDAVNPMPPMTYNWVESRENMGKFIDYPSKLYLIIDSNKEIVFDYYSYFQGFIISEQFYIFLQRNTRVESDYQVVPLKVVDIKGKNISKKEYYYLRFIFRPQIIDLEKSEYFLRTGEDEEFAKKTGIGILGFKKIVFKKDVVILNPFFYLADTIFMLAMSVSKELVSEIQGLDFIGFKISSPEEFSESYRKRHDPNYIDMEKIKRKLEKRRQKDK